MSAAERDRAAAEWVARRDAHPDDPAVAAGLEAWVEADPLRRGALLRAEAAWALMGDALAPAGARAVPLARPPRSGWRKAAAGAALLAASLAGVAVWDMGRDSYRTGVGELRQVPLADGSAVTLNTASRVRADFEPERRSLVLARGEAVFRVQPDRRRPFTVQAGDVRVTAVGTVFSVRRMADGDVGVAVAEGVVEARRGDAAPFRMKAGERATFEADAPQPAVTRASVEEIERGLSWQAGRLDLDGETLAHAVAEMNRYTDRPIRVADPSLAREPLFGVFRTTDPEGFARAAGASLRARVTVAEREIVIGG